MTTGLSMGNESCGNCRFWLRSDQLQQENEPEFIGSEYQYGYCRRYPPIWAGPTAAWREPLDGGSRSTESWCYPPTEAASWCGEYKPQAAPAGAGSAKVREERWRKWEAEARPVVMAVLSRWRWPRQDPEAKKAAPVLYEAVKRVGETWVCPDIPRSESTPPDDLRPHLDLISRADLEQIARGLLGTLRPSTLSPILVKIIERNTGARKAPG